MAKRKRRRRHIPGAAPNQSPEGEDIPKNTPAKPSQLTANKLLRLGLKSMVFALIVSTLVTLLGLLNIAFFKTLWFQVGTMLVVYLLAYPYLMREFRPPNSARSTIKKSR